jgi:hypothetical protein
MSYLCLVVESSTENMIGFLTLCNQSHVSQLKSIHQHATMPYTVEITSRVDAIINKMSIVRIVVNIEENNTP